MARVAFIGLGHMGGGMAPTSPRRGMRSAPSTSARTRWPARSSMAASAPNRPPRRARTPMRSSPCCRPASMSPRSIASHVFGNAPKTRDPDRLLDDRRRHRQGGRGRSRGAGLHDGRRAGVRRDRRGRGRDPDLHGRRHATTGSRRAREYLEKMGKAVIHAGDPGAGQAAKICNNMLLGRDHGRDLRGVRAGAEARPRPADLLRHFVQGLGPELVDDQLLPGPRRRPGNPGRPRL